MLLDIATVQDAARDLWGSGRTVNDAAMRIADSAAAFDVGKAGRYHPVYGERLREGLDGVRRYLFGWANCVYDCGSALRTGIDDCVGADRAIATELGAVAEALR
ncbi:hypothetical protein [Nocardia paucivorans]|mgnify:CR=1 FL=1|uniref:hypothetical protein n=1 Tax=Nocardia paucivorans TaxID=114259 RepID=UPI0002F589B1|nr:hypothetical protein [Nocardia paucivorans]